MGRVAFLYGAVPKRLKGAALKAVRQGNLCVGSNPTGAAIFIFRKEVLTVVLDDELIEIMDKDPWERAPDEQQAYIRYLEGVWKWSRGKRAKEEEETSADQR